MRSQESLTDARLDAWEEDGLLLAGPVLDGHSYERDTGPEIWKVCSVLKCSQRVHAEFERVCSNGSLDRFRERSY